MKKGVTKTKEVNESQLMKYPGYILNSTSLKSPIFVNQNVWESVDKAQSLQKKSNQTADRKSDKTRQPLKNTKVYEMLNYSNGHFVQGSGSKQNPIRQYCRPLTSPNQIILTPKSELLDKETKDLKTYLEETFDIRGRDDHAKAQIRLKNEKKKTDVILLKVLEEGSTNDRDPLQGILKTAPGSSKARPLRSKKHAIKSIDLPSARILKEMGTSKSDGSAPRAVKKPEKKKRTDVIHVCIEPSSSLARLKISAKKIDIQHQKVVQLPSVPLYTSKKKSKKTKTVPKPES